MLNQQTNEATDVMNLNSDTNLSGLGIGQSEANIDLDKKGKQFDWPGKIKPEDLNKHSTHNKQKEPDLSWKWEAMNEHYGNENYKDHRDQEQPKAEEKPKEEAKPTTQGEYEQTLQNHYKNIEKIEAEIKKIENLLNTPMASKFGEDVINHFNEQLQNKENQIIDIRNSIHDIMNNKEYDDRTPDQKREDEKQQNLEERQDNSYQRAVADMLKAGINPASLQGGAVSGGGGSTGGSKSEEEEEKRKRKKREEEARRAAEEEAKRRQIMQVLGAIGGMATMFGTTAMRNVGMRNSANIRANALENVEKSRSKDRQVAMIYKDQQHERYMNRDAYLKKNYPGYR